MRAAFLSPAALATLALLATLAALPVRAQSVHWDPPSGTLPVGQATQLNLVFDGCSPEGTPAVPKVDGLTLASQGQSSNITLINTDITRTTTINFAALLTKKQRIEIPAFDVDTNKGKVHVAPARFDPAGATVGGSGIALDQVASSHLTPAPASVWTGEVFNLDYAIDASHNYYPNFGNGAFDWNPSPLEIEDWSQPEPFESKSGTEPRAGLVYRTRAISRNPGRFHLNQAGQLVNLSIGVSGFGFFPQREYQQFSVQSNAPTIEVKPLPPAPSGFNGAVGNFKLTAKVAPSQVAVGDPVTWTLELSGQGNWPDIAGLPPREVSKDFQVVQPKPKRVQKQGKLFEATLTEDVVLISSQPGTYELPSSNFVYFDPKSGSFQTITAPGATVTIVPAAGAQAGGPAPSAATPAPGALGPSTESSEPTARAPEAPGAVPRDPLPDSGPAPRLLDSGELAAGIAAPFVLLALFWTALAWRRARRTDPLKPLREARSRLDATIAALAKADESQRAALLLAWQRDAAALWQIAHAAPPPQAFDEPEWTALWEEADRRLYGPDGKFPADWVPRAEAALGAKTVPSFSPARLFLPGNLLPFFVIAVAGLAVRIAAAAAALPPASAYRQGDFASAEKGWRQAIETAPTNWSARHNLSLALSQQDRWGEAAAEAAAAFVQNPANLPVRFQLALACDKAGFVPSALAPLLPPSGISEEIGRLASPAQWQWVAIGAAAAAAAALALLLALGYGTIGGRWTRNASFTLLGLALLLALSSWLGFRSYGLAADDRAVVAWRPGTLRSIPTEADVSQKTSPLPAGSVAVADKAYLDWVRLGFSNGQTGWVRKAEVIGLWR